MGPARGRRGVRLPDDARLPDLRRVVGGADRRAPRAVPRRDHPLARWRADVLFSEFGLPTASPRGGSQGTPRTCRWSRRMRRRATRERVLDGLRGAGCTGAMLWCYADYARDLWTDPPLDEAVHERSFGLWRADGSAKPAVGAVRRIRGCRRESALPDDGWIDIDAGSVLGATGRGAPATVRSLQGDTDRRCLTNDAGHGTVARSSSSSKRGGRSAESV